MGRAGRMIVIVEGPDGAGKTTLAREMCRLTGARYVHLTYRWPLKMFLYHTAAILSAAASEGPVVIDRWWPSEAVYAAEFRGGSRWPHMGRFMDRVARSLGAVYVACLPGQNHAERFRSLKSSREEMYESVSGVSRRYEALFRGGSDCADGYSDVLASHGGMLSREDVVEYSIETKGDRLGDVVDEVLATHSRLRLSPHLPWAIGAQLLRAKRLFVRRPVRGRLRSVRWPWYEYDELNVATAGAIGLEYDAAWTTTDMLDRALRVNPSVEVIRAEHD